MTATSSSWRDRPVEDVLADEAEHVAKLIRKACVLTLGDLHARIIDGAEWLGLTRKEVDSVKSKLRKIVHEAARVPAPVEVEPMGSVTIAGVDYLTPFAALFRPLTDAEAADLRQSLGEHGVKDPIKVAKTPGWGRIVIDGHTRSKFAADLGLTVPFLDLGELSDATARSLAIDLNASRRQLTPAEQAAARARRNELILTKRAEGKSERVIAAEIGVSAPTVHRVLEQAGDSTATRVAVEPERITGADGRSRPATMPKREPTPATDDEGEPTEEVALLDEPAAELFDEHSQAGIRTKIAHFKIKTARELLHFWESGGRMGLSVPQQAEVESALDAVRDGRTPEPPEPEKPPSRSKATADHPPPSISHDTPGHRAVAARPDFDELLLNLRRSLAAIPKLWTGPGGEYLRPACSSTAAVVHLGSVERKTAGGTVVKAEWVCEPLANLIRLVRALRPADKVCAGCNGRGCKACSMAGFVPADPNRKPSQGETGDATFRADEWETDGDE